MADHSKKSKTNAKKALLGELESIKSLLEESPGDDIIDFDGDGDAAADDEAIDPPILTTTVEPEAEADDVPILTDAFDTVVADIESSRQEASPAKAPGFEEPEFAQWPEDSADPDTEATASSAEHQTQEDENSNEAESSADSLFDDLEAEFEQQFDETDTAQEASDASENELAAAPEPPTINEIEAEPKTAPAAKQSARRESQPSLFDEPRPSVPDIAEKSGSSQKTDQKQWEVSKAASESNKTAGDISQPLSKSAVKTDNPFLPKHIRDRLHTNRSLQDEITSISTASTAATQQPPAAKSKEKAQSKPDNNEEQLINELVKVYLPKIEQQLRQRLRESLNSKSDDPDKS